jgi:hypothetical protein
VRELGSRAFQAAETKGGALNEAVANKFYNEIMKIRPQTMEGRVFFGESQVSKLFDKIPELMNRPMTLRAAQEIDEALGDLAYSTMDNFGRMSKDGKKFIDMQAALRNTIDAVDEKMVIGGKEGFNAIKEARKYWSTSLKMRDIERIISRAQNMEQPVTAIKTGFRNLLQRGDKLKGYSAQEVSAIKKAANTGVFTDIVRLAGSGLVPIGMGIGGTAVSGPMGGTISALAGAALQQGAKKAGTAIQMNKANKVLEELTKGAGLAKQTTRISGPQALAKLLAPPTAGIVPGTAPSALAQLLQQP